MEALMELIQAVGVDKVQLRNLNIDPHRLFKALPAARGRIAGVPVLIRALRDVPGLAVGSFTSAVR
jgi:hypothetical protein